MGYIAEYRYVPLDRVWFLRFSILNRPLTSVPPVTGRDEPWPFFHF